MSAPPRRAFRVALIASLLLHLVVIAAPGLHLPGLGNDAELPVLEARLAQAPAPAPKPAAPRKAAPKPLPAAAPVAAPSEVVGPVALAEPAAPAPQAPATPPATVAAPANAPEILPPLPKKGRIRYGLLRGEGGMLIGQSLHEWQHDGKHYSLTATSQTTGLAALFKPLKVVQSSSGAIVQGELKPDQFRFDRGEGDVVSAAFDWPAAKVTLGNGQVSAIGDGAEDMLSMFYQLMQAAQRGGDFQMAVATGRKVERYAFEWLPEEKLVIKAGTFNAWRVRVRAAGGGADVTEVWLGREVAGLPVKIRNIDRKGELFDQIAEEIEYEGK
ncbi:MAG TPA: DUF3108 domain-containing protein [Rhodocyclaceae bacterium]